MIGWFKSDCVATLRHEMLMSAKMQLPDRGVLFNDKIVVDEKKTLVLKYNFKPNKVWCRQIVHQHSRFVP